MPDRNDLETAMTFRTGRRRGSGRAMRKTAWRERAFVLGGLGLALAGTAAILALGAGRDLIGPLWMAATAWTAAAQIAHVLWLGLRHGDWSAFEDRQLPADEDSLDWSTRTGAYAYMRVADEHERLMRGHGYSATHDH